MTGPAKTAKKEGLMTHQYGESCLQSGDARCVTCQLTGRGVDPAPSPPPSEKEERNEVEAVIRALQARIRTAWHEEERNLLALKVYELARHHPAMPLNEVQLAILAAEGVYGPPDTREDWEPRAEWLCQRDEQDELDAAEDVASTLWRRGLSRLGS